MPRPSEKGHTRDTSVYSLRVKGDLRAQWEEYCAKADRKPADTIRALMRYMMKDDMPPEVRAWIAAQVDGVPDDEAKARLELRLTQSEYSAVKERSEAEGTSVQRYVVNCVRASLTNAPQFTMAVTKALWESSYQLRAVGRNLNQIAKAMNQGKEQTFNQEQIDKLGKYIYRHTDKVDAALDASLSRWRIKP